MRCVISTAQSRRCVPRLKAGMNSKIEYLINKKCGTLLMTLFVGCCELRHSFGFISFVPFRSHIMGYICKSFGAKLTISTHQFITYFRSAFTFAHGVGNRWVFQDLIWRQSKFRNKTPFICSQVALELHYIDKMLEFAVGWYACVFLF